MFHSGGEQSSVVGRVVWVVPQLRLHLSQTGRLPHSVR